MVEEVAPQQVWDALNSDPDATLVDVRTDIEWARIGLPDLGGANQADDAVVLAGGALRAGEYRFRA